MNITQSIVQFLFKNSTKYTDKVKKKNVELKRNLEFTQVENVTPGIEHKHCGYFSTGFQITENHVTFRELRNVLLNSNVFFYRKNLLKIVSTVSRKFLKTSEINWVHNTSRYWRHTE